MARPREFDATAALDAIKNVFWLKGYDATSYADLTEATGLHKQSLYGAFGDKQALYMRALAAYDDNEVSNGVAMLEGHGQKGSYDGKKRIEALLNAAIDAVGKHQDRRGCLLCNAAIDRAPFDPEVETVVSSGVMRIQKAVEKALKSDPTLKKKNLNLAQTSTMVTAAYFGIRVMAKSGIPPAIMKSARDGALKSI